MRKAISRSAAEESNGVFERVRILHGHGATRTRAGGAYGRRLQHPARHGTSARLHMRSCSCVRACSSRSRSISTYACTSTKEAQLDLVLLVAGRCVIDNIHVIRLRSAPQVKPWGASTSRARRVYIRVYHMYTHCSCTLRTSAAATTTDDSTVHIALRTLSASDTVIPRRIHRIPSELRS